MYLIVLPRLRRGKNLPIGSLISQRVPVSWDVNLLPWQECA